MKKPPHSIPAMTSSRSPATHTACSSPSPSSRSSLNNKRSLHDHKNRRPHRTWRDALAARDTATPPAKNAPSEVVRRGGRLEEKSHSGNRVILEGQHGLPSDEPLQPGRHTDGGDERAQSLARTVEWWAACLWSFDRRQEGVVESPQARKDHEVSLARSASSFRIAPPTRGAKLSLNSTTSHSSRLPCAYSRTAFKLWISIPLIEMVEREGIEPSTPAL
jgi:hypothetical protein